MHTLFVSFLLLASILLSIYIIKFSIQSNKKWSMHTIVQQLQYDIREYREKHSDEPIDHEASQRTLSNIITIIVLIVGIVLAIYLGVLLLVLIYSIISALFGLWFF